MGETGFCKNLRFSAVSCENLRFPAVFCANLRLPNPLIYRASRKSAKICKNLRKCAFRVRFLPFAVSLLARPDLNLDFCTSETQEGCGCPKFLARTAFGQFSTLLENSSLILQQHEMLSLLRFEHFPARKMAAGNRPCPAFVREGANKTQESFQHEEFWPCKAPKFFMLGFFSCILKRKEAPNIKNLQGQGPFEGEFRRGVSGGNSMFMPFLGT